MLLEKMRSEKNNVMNGGFECIMETNAIRNDLASFFASHKVKGGYAYYGWNGTTYYSNEAGSQSRCMYGSSIKYDDVIEMKLDMTNEQTKKLSFRINDVDQGIAWANFDLNKAYSMAIAIYDVEDSIDIID